MKKMILGLFAALALLAGLLAPAPAQAVTVGNPCISFTGGGQVCLTPYTGQYAVNSVTLSCSGPLKSVNPVVGQALRITSPSESGSYWQAGAAKSDINNYCSRSVAIGIYNYGVNCYRYIWQGTVKRTNNTSTAFDLRFNQGPGC